MKLRDYAQRPRTRVAAGIFGVLTVLTGLAVTGCDRHPPLTAEAQLRISRIESQVDLVRQFDALGPAPLTVRSGVAAFMQLQWRAESAIGDDCQLQLAVHNPSEWRLIGWAGGPDIANATANSWGTVQEIHTDLRDIQATIILPPSREGKAMLVWQLVDESDAGLPVVRAYIVHSCGDADRSATVTPVHLKR